MPPFNYPGAGSPPAKLASVENPRISPLRCFVFVCPPFYVTKPTIIPTAIVPLLPFLPFNDFTSSSSTPRPNPPSPPSRPPPYPAPSPTPH